MKKLTKNDLDNLNKLPENKWFKEIEVWPAVKRTTYSLGRLREAGYVEMDVRGSLPYVFYRKIKNYSTKK